MRVSASTIMVDHHFPAILSLRGSLIPALTPALLDTGDASKLPERQLRKVEDWLEREETTLRQATLSRDPQFVFSAQQQLVLALSGRGSFLGSQLTVADIAIFSTLKPFASSEKVRQDAAGIHALKRETGFVISFVSVRPLVSFS